MAAGGQIEILVEVLLDGPFGRAQSGSFALLTQPVAQPGKEKR